MRPSHRIPLALVLLVVLAGSAVAQEPSQPVSEATLPLEEILRLHREIEQAKEKPDEAPPPVEATVHQLDVTGRLLDGAVDFTARFEVVVLDDGWVRVPLLVHDAATHLSALPKVKSGFFAVDDGYLSFMTRVKGVYSFELSLLKEAVRSNRQRQVRLEYAQAALAVCRVSYDEGLFRLRSERAIERSDGVLLFPESNAFEIEWERRVDAVVAKQKTAPPPAIESIVPVAHASVVSTLEGRNFIRLRYELRFAGSKTIEFEVPVGLTVDRAYVNGVSTETVSGGEGLSIEVAPVREGDQSGVLELVLSSSQDGYFLSGTREVVLPRVSWPVNEMFVDVHLPRVFNYAWSGGSLSPVDQTPSTSYTYELPEPGKRLSFHQHLISASAPNVTLGYAVDLEGHYYRP